MYKRYFELEEEAINFLDLGFTSTFEFFIHNGKLMCEYNASSPKPLVKFLNRSYYPEIRPLFQKIAKYIVTKYGHFDTVKYWIKSKMKWEEILVEFILKYFSKYDNKLDIVIKANGDVSFNLEESFLKESNNFPLQIMFTKEVKIKQPSYIFKSIPNAIYKRKNFDESNNTALYQITDSRNHGIDLKKLNKHDLQISYSEIKKLADRGIIKLFGTKLN